MAYGPMTFPHGLYRSEQVLLVPSRNHHDHSQIWAWGLGYAGRHEWMFADVALRCFDNDVVYSRVHELANQEAEIITGLEWRPSLH